MADVGELPLAELARLHVLRGPQLMWLLGAGSSAGAGVATAGQMMEEFRALIYSTKQQVPLVALNLAEPAIRDRIDRFFAETPGYPSPGDSGEYSALFEAAWSNPADRPAALHREQDCSGQASLRKSRPGGQDCSRTSADHLDHELRPGC